MSICCICGGTYPGDGHNAYPVKEGRCCTICNQHIVVPTRINKALEEMEA